MPERPPRATGGGDYPTFDPGPTPPRTGPRRPAPPPRRPPGRADQPYPFLVGLAIATVLVLLSIVAFGVFASGETTPDATGTTVADPADSATTPTGAATEDTTDDTSVDTTGSVTQLPGSGDAISIAAVGIPIAISDLTMSSNDIGPLEFGDDGDDVLGRLVSTFGQPTDDTGFIVGNGGFGECPGDSIRVVRWGPLLIVTKGQPSDHVFSSYRMDLSYGGITTPPTDMKTLSGLRVGDSVGELEAIYEDFIIEYVVHQEAGLVFELRASRGGDLLLWGPVDSQAPDALVTGIYSPDSCGADS